MDLNRRKFLTLPFAIAGSYLAAKLMGGTTSAQASKPLTMVSDPCPWISPLPQVKPIDCGIGTTWSFVSYRPVEVLGYTLAPNENAVFYRGINGWVRIWGDGVHDDTSYIQAVIDTGGTVYLHPNRQYRVNTLLWKPTDLPHLNVACLDRSPGRWVHPDGGTFPTKLGVISLALMRVRPFPPMVP